LRSLFFDQEKKGFSRFLKKDEEKILRYLWNTRDPKSVPELAQDLGINENKLQKTLRSLRRRKIVNKQARRNSPVRWVWRAELGEKELASRLIKETIDRLTTIFPDEITQVVAAFKKR